MSKHCKHQNNFSEKKHFCAELMDLLLCNFCFVLCIEFKTKLFSKQCRKSSRQDVMKWTNSQKKRGRILQRNYEKMRRKTCKKTKLYELPFKNKDDDLINQEQSTINILITSINHHSNTHAQFDSDIFSICEKKQTSTVPGCAVFVKLQQETCSVRPLALRRPFVQGLEQQQVLLSWQYRCQSFPFVVQITDLFGMKESVCSALQKSIQNNSKVMGSPDTCEIMQRYILSSSVSLEELLSWPYGKCKSPLSKAKKTLLGCKFLVHFVSTCAGRQFLVLVTLETSSSGVLKCKIKASMHHLPFGPTTQQLVRFSLSAFRTMNQDNLCIFHVYFGLVKVCIPRPHLDSKLSLARVHFEVYSISYYLITKNVDAITIFLLLFSEEWSIQLPQQVILLEWYFSSFSCSITSVSFS